MYGVEVCVLLDIVVLERGWDKYLNCIVYSVLGYNDLVGMIAIYKLYLGRVSRRRRRCIAGRRGHDGVRPIP